MSDKTITPKDLLISILEECLSVSDEWGGSKLANWQYGHNVLVEGIENAAQRIIKEMLILPSIPGTASDVCQDLMKAIQDINVTIVSIREDTKEFNKTSKILGKGI